jgi:hypothetical protein
MKPKSPEAPASGAPTIAVRLADGGADRIGPQIGEALYRDTTIVATEPKPIDKRELPFGKLIDSLGEPYTNEALATRNTFSAKQRRLAARSFWGIGLGFGTVVWALLAAIFFSCPHGNLSPSEFLGILGLSFILAFASGWGFLLIIAHGNSGGEIIARKRLGVDPPGNEKDLIRTRLMNSHLGGTVHAHATYYSLELYKTAPGEGLKDLLSAYPNTIGLSLILFWLKSCLKEKEGAAANLEKILQQYTLLQEHVYKSVLTTNLDSYMDQWAWHHARNHDREATDLEQKITDAIYALIETLRPMEKAIDELVRLLNVPNPQIRDYVAAYDWIKKHITVEMLQNLLEEVQRNPLSTKLPDP